MKHPRLQSSIALSALFLLLLASANAEDAQTLYEEPEQLEELKEPQGEVHVGPTPAKVIVPGEEAREDKHVRVPHNLQEEPLESFTVEPTASVKVSPTEDADPDGMGALREDSGGLPADIWRDTNRAAVSALFARIPEAVPSHALRDLLRRALLSEATLNWPSRAKQGGNFVADRAQLLLRQGFAADALALAQLVPESMRDERLNGFIVDGLMLTGKTDAACELEKTLRGTYTGEHWQQRRPVCKALSNKPEEAMLDMDVMREQNISVSEFMGHAVKQLTDKTHKITNWPKSWSSTEAALIPLLADDDLVQVQGAKLPLHVLAPLMQKVTLYAESKALLQERAVQFDLEKPAALAQSYGGIVFDEKALAVTAKDTKKFEGTKGRALLYQMVLKAAAPQAKAELIEAAFTAYKSAKLTRTAHALYAPLLKMLDVAAFDAKISPAFLLQAVAALCDQKDFITAQKWADALAGRDKAQGALAHIMVAFARGNAAPDAASGSVLATLTREEDKQRLFRLIGMMQALGDDVAVLEESLAGMRLTLPVEMPSPLLQQRLREVTGSERKGDAILLTAVVLGESDLGRISNAALGDAIRALKQAGFEPEARALAREAVLATGN